DCWSCGAQAPGKRSAAPRREREFLPACPQGQTNEWSCNGALFLVKVVEDLDRRFGADLGVISTDKLRVHAGVLPDHPVEGKITFGVVAHLGGAEPRSVRNPPGHFFDARTNISGDAVAHDLGHRTAG